jgi:serine/threonine protein kinase
VQRDQTGPPSPRLRAAMDELRTLFGVAGKCVPGDIRQASLAFLFPPERPGTLGRFGPYDILEEIDRGAMGIVFKAHDPALDRVVAIKVLSPILAANPTARTRFLREARAAAAVSHEHVVDIHAVDEFNGLPYLVMQFIAGQSLRERIRTAGSLGLEEMLRIGIQVASGLAAAHAQGLIHRDIKPANILLEDGIERVRITDFGLARTVDAINPADSGWLAGTPEFMAPEQARGGPVDFRADLFSLGCVLYCMATGESPFAAATLLSVIRRLCEEEARPVCEANPALPGWFGEIVGQLLAKDPAQRPQSAHEVARTLERRLAQVQSCGQPSAAAREPVPPGQAAPPDRMPAPDDAPQRIASPQPGRRTNRRRLGRVSLGAVVIAALALALVHVTTRSPQLRARGVFQVLGPQGKTTGAFPTLTEAVRAAHSGDTIEIKANGPFELEPVTLGDKALTIRAATGVLPKFISRPEAKSVLTTDAALVLEGLEFQAGESRPAFRPAIPGQEGSLVRSRGAPLCVANCRFQTPFRRWSAIGSGVVVDDSPDVELRNCELYIRGGCGIIVNCTAAPPGWDSTTAGLCLRIENCLQLSETALLIAQRAPVRATVTLLHNTVSGRVVLGLPSLVVEPGLSLNVCSNAFDCHYVLVPGLRVGGGALRDALHWQESHNVFGVVRTFCGTELDTSAPDLNDLNDWNRYWNQTNTGSVLLRLERRTPFLPRADTAAAPDFELTTGHYDQIVAAGGDRAIPYGAALEQVGPGAAYDAWRRGPEYQQWQERIRQVRLRTPGR